MLRNYLLLKKNDFVVGEVVALIDMKKYFIVAIMAVLGLCASAQQGDKAIGVDIGFAPCLEDHADFTNFGLGVKFQYNVTNPVRLEADLDYWFEAKHVSVFDITANVHYLVGVGKGFTVYPLAGVGYANVDSHGNGYHRFVFNLGIGGEYALTSNLTLGLELKYQYINDFSRFPINIGLAYHF